MKKIFGNRKHVGAGYEFLKLLIIFKEISEEETLRSKISKLELSSREERAYISNKEKYYFNSSRRSFSFLLKNSLFVSRLLVTRFIFLIMYNILKSARRRIYLKILRDFCLKRDNFDL